MNKQFQQIGNTPLSISVYSAEKTSTHIHDKGLLEIIFCLKGSVCFSYAHEEFTLHEGEYISVDRDAYYLYDGKDNLCVSLLFDLKYYEKEYPYVLDNPSFICEGLEESTMPYPTKYHGRLKGMMIALLKHIISGGDEECVTRTCENIIRLFIEHFDEFFFHTGKDFADQDMISKLHEAKWYMNTHLKEKVAIGDLAEKLNFTEGYMSEFMRKNTIGFRVLMGYIRVNESEHYLLKTDKTILEISEECGFSDVKYYYAAFKRWYHCTPKQFREQYGKMSEENITYYTLDDITDIMDKLMTEHYMDTFLD